MATTAALSKGGATHVAGELIVLFRCVRETRAAGEEHARFEKNAKVLMDELGTLVATIRDKSLSERARGKAMAKISSALAYVADTQELILLSNFQKTGVLPAIVSLCSEVEATNLYILGNGLALLSNVAFMAQTDLIVKAGTAGLLLKLLCRDAKATAAVLSYAVRALSNMVSDPIGASAFTVPERAELLAGLDAMSTAGSTPRCSYFRHRSPGPRK